MQIDSKIERDKENLTQENEVISKLAINAVKNDLEKAQQ